MKTTKPIAEARASYESPAMEVINVSIEANIMSGPYAGSPLDEESGYTL